MKIEEIIFILENRIKSLMQQRDNAIMSGNLDIVNQIDAELVETQNTLETLKKS
jgi:hypothetical protein